MRELWPDLAETSALTLRMGLGGGTRSFRNVMLNVDRAGRPEQIWFDADCSPIMDAQGAPAGTLIIYGETTQRVLAEERAAREIERLRRMFEQAPGFICFLSGPNYIVEFVNEAHKQLFGDHHAEGRRFVEAFADVGAHEALDRVFASGQRYVGRAEPVLIPKPDGRIEEHLLDVVLEPVTDDDGQVIGLFIEGLDVTEQVRAQEAADESERRLSAAVAVARLGAFEWNIDSGKATMDERAREIFAFGPNEDLTIQDVISHRSRGHEANPRRPGGIRGGVPDAARV